MASYVLALDQGTTSSRAILFDHEGHTAAVAQEEFPQIYPRPGWVEHDPEAIWSSQYRVAQQALEMVGVTAEQVKAVGVTNQRETTLVWDRATGKPVYNAIVWQCRRTVQRCEQLRLGGHADDVRARTGLVLDAYFSGTKLEWILENVPGVRERADRGELAFGTVDSFLLWKLTGGALHATDVSNASRTMLYNIHAQAWDETLLELLHIPPSLLPAVLPSSAIYGKTTPTLFGAAIPIGGAAGDQHAATFGQACQTPGMVKNTYGTGCFMLMNTGERAVQSPDGLLTTIGWRLGEHGKAIYALEGSVFIAGAAIQWLRDEMKLISSAAESEAIASSIQNTGGVYVVPAFVGLGAPYWDGFARGSISGLTRGSGRSQVVRATLESIAYQTRDVLDIMRRDAGLKLPALRVDGGAVRNNWLMQFQADILGVPVQRPAVTETSALGAAYLAGLGVGFWESPEQIAKHWVLERTFEPMMSADQRETLYAGWKRAVERAKGWDVQA